MADQGRKVVTLNIPTLFRQRENFSYTNKPRAAKNIPS